MICSKTLVSKDKLGVGGVHISPKVLDNYE